MSELLSLLQTIQQQSLELLDCLKHEKRVLDNNQLEKLNEISSQKQILLTQLNQLDKQRSARSADKNFNDFIANSNNPLLIKQWHTTRKAIQYCQQQNEVNGRLLYKRSQINQDVLSIITGHSLQTNETYDAQGSQTNSTSLFNGIKA